MKKEQIEREKFLKVHMLAPEKKHSDTVKLRAILG
jgi:hypothetical protein